MKMEIWKDLKNFEGFYAISTLGKVKRIKHKRYDRNQILNEREVKVIYPKNKMYPYFNVCKNGITKSLPLHRALATTFLPNPNNYPCINHIDGNKQNNKLDNLEWCTYSHNNREAHRLGLNKGTAKEVYQYDKSMNLIGIWKSGRKAELTYNIRHIADCCNGKRKTSGGYIWRYE